MEKYVGNTIKDNSTEFYTHKLSNQGTVEDRDGPDEVPMPKDLTVKCIGKRIYTNNHFTGR